MGSLLHAALIAGLFLATACAPPVPRSLTVQPASAHIVADGVSRIPLSVNAPDGSRFTHAKLAGKVIAGHGRVVPSEDGLVLVPGVMPGALTVEISAPGARRERVEVQTALYTRDTFGDGTPDFLRLSDSGDRAAFRHWFVTLAERQALPAGKLPREINDCAALLRYAFREALRRHDSTWATDSDLGQLAAAPDVAKYAHPYTPLGPRLFRVRGGGFRASDLNDGTFAEFADAKTLIAHNTHFLSRDVRLAKPGDLLFFRQFGQRSPFHSMVFVGHSHFSDGVDWVVYHTGPSGGDPGEMRRVPLAQLLAHPNAQWRPEPGNRNFLGVYRWNILREAQ